MRFSKFDVAKYQPLYVPLSIFAGCLAIALAIYASGGIRLGGVGSEQGEAGSPSVAGAQCEDLPEPEEVAVSVDDDFILGDPDAPLTMIMFNDAACGFCGKFFNETLPRIKENFIDGGVLRFVIRDFAIHGETASLVAEAAQCAGDQGKFWEFWEKVFADQRSASSEDKLKEWAGELGLDLSAFSECFDSREHQNEVAKDGQDAQSYGVRGTPSFFLGKTSASGAFGGVLEWECRQGRGVPVFESEEAEMIVGAYPYEDDGQYQGFKSRIEAALAK